MCKRCMTRTLAQIEQIIQSEFKLGQDVHAKYILASIQNIFAEAPKCIAMKALEELTPGGSEYYEDVVRCYAMVKESRETMHRVAVRIAQQRDEAVAKYMELAKVVADIIGSDTPPKKKEEPS